MNSVILLSFISVFGFISANNEVVLTSTPDHAVNGKPFTLICSMDPALNSTNIVWYRKSTAVFISSMMGYTTIIDVNQTEIHNVFGRFFINMHGFSRHHLTLLVDAQKDEGSSWRCQVYGREAESNMITIHTIDADNPSQCGLGCILGATTGIAVTALIVDLLVCSRCLKRL